MKTRKSLSSLAWMVGTSRANSSTRSLIPSLRMTAAVRPSPSMDRYAAAICLRSSLVLTTAAQAFSDFVASLPRSAGKELWAPGFSHAAKDPVEKGVRVGPEHRVVLVEGLYCTADENPWRRGAELANERWLLHVERDIARERLVRRHVEAGIAPDPEIALWRAENNDLPNGDWVLQHALHPYREIKSETDTQWASEVN